MATSSIVMLSNISMERLYLSQPPAWNDLQRLPYSVTQQASSQQQQQDGRSSQQVIRTCYDKLLHHIYDMNSSVSATTTTINQIKEQLDLAAEYCQLKTLPDGDKVYLHSDNFYLQVEFDPLTHLPADVLISFTNEQRNNEECLTCSRMLKALNDKQYRLFRAHLNGYASLFTLVAPTMNNDKRVGYTAYKVLQQDLERLMKTESYGKMLEGFQPICEGLPMRVRVKEQADNDRSLPSYVRIIIVPSPGQHYLSMKSAVHIDEKSNQVHLESPSMKSSLLATGHFALEFDEKQAPFTLLLNHAQEISRATNLDQFLANAKPFNYLAKIIPKSKPLNHYQWYISHDQLAVSIRQIPFSNVKQLMHILGLLRQQIYLTRSLNHYFHSDYEHDHMEDDTNSGERDIFLELSFLSSTILSITCAQSSHLSTFLLQMSNLETFPLLSHRQQQKEIYLTAEKNSLLKLIEQLLHEETLHQGDASSTTTATTMDYSSTSAIQKPVVRPLSMPKLNRRLSCGPPAKPAWRSATTLRRLQPACFTLTSKEEQQQEKIDDDHITDEDPEPSMMNDDDNDDDDLFMSVSFQPAQQSTSLQHQQLLPKPSLSLNPSVLSRCTSVSSTQSVSTPPLFGLTPSTPYPGGGSNPSGNIFFPLAKQVSVPDFNPVSPPISMGAFDPSVFSSTHLPSGSNAMPSADPNNKNQGKKKRRRSDHSADELIQSIGTNPNDNRSPMLATKLPSSGGDASNMKRSKKPQDKNSQQPQQQQPSQLVRQKSSFKVTDSPTGSLLPQTQVTSPDEATGDFKPLKVVIKRVGDGGNSSNDESQQQASKQRKKLSSQQSMTNLGGSLPLGGRKLTHNMSADGSVSSVLIKSESFDVNQFPAEGSSNSMMNMGDSAQQASRERPRPSSSLSNPSSSLSSSIPSQPRSAPPQPPIVLKIQRSKVYSGQEQPASASSATSLTSTASAPPPPTTGVIPSATKEALKNRARPGPPGASLNKTPVTSPPLLAAKLTSPSTSITNNPLAPAGAMTSYRIPRKSSSQEVAVKPKTEPGTVTNTVSPVPAKAPLLPTPGNPNDLSKAMNRSLGPSNIRPPAPPAPISALQSSSSSSSQIGSWQSPPTQQPSRLHQNRPRGPWSQQQAPRGRAPVTPPNIGTLPGTHPAVPSFSQQPRSILKKLPSSDPGGSDLLFMPTSDLSAFNEQRGGINFSQPSSSLLSRSATPPGMYDNNDDDTSPQAQLVIDTSSTAANNALLPYTMVPGSNSSSNIDNFDPAHENHSMGTSSQQQQQQQQYFGDDSSSLLD